MKKDGTRRVAIMVMVVVVLGLRMVTVLVLGGTMVW
jgi:hypothetical protein